MKNHTQSDIALNIQDQINEGIENISNEVYSF